MPKRTGVVHLKSRATGIDLRTVVGDVAPRSLRFTVSIVCYTDAFQDYIQGEVKRILIELASEVTTNEDGPWMLTDADGNIVGKAEFTEY